MGWVWRTSANAGRFFPKDFVTDSLSLVLNKKAVEYFELKDPIGSRMTGAETFVRRLKRYLQFSHYWPFSLPASGYLGLPLIPSCNEQKESAFAKYWMICDMVRRLSYR
jgi:hypothetical protein